MYNNHAYNIAGLVLRKATGQDCGSFVQHRIFSPLKMSRTTTSQTEGDNMALPYKILQDGISCRIPFSGTSEKTLVFAGQSVRTSLGDPMKYCRAWIESTQKYSGTEMGLQDF